MSKIVLTAASRVGCVRSNNEDMVLAFNKQVRSDIHQIVQDTADCHRFVIALADGMGGHSAGEVASELVLSNLDFFVSDLPDGLTPEQVVEQLNAWLQSVNILVNSNGNSDPSKRDMGTTLVAVLYYDGHFYWMSCGDSRLYRLRGGKLNVASFSCPHQLYRSRYQEPLPRYGRLYPRYAAWRRVPAVL